MRARRARLPLLVLASAVLVGCSYNPMLYPWRYPDPVEEPTHYLARLRAAARPPTGDEWSLPPAEAERLLQQGEFEIEGAHGTEGGMTGALRLDLRIEGQPLRVKWKRAPQKDADGWNDSPRKELAAYAIQKWFLDPRDYVVPPVAVRCIDEETLRPWVPGLRPNMAGLECVVSSLALWLENVEMREDFYEPERFARDPNYAYHAANLNVLTVLVNHRDSKPHNFPVSKNRANRRIFAVDNGISFGSVIWNFRVLNWNRVRVPALRREAIERLRKVERADVDALARLARFVRRGDRLEPVEAGAQPAREPDLQLGLGYYERDALWHRLRNLIAGADRGEIPLF